MMLCLAILCSVPVTDARAMTLVPDPDLSVPPATAFVLADVTGIGRTELVAVGPQGLFVLAPAGSDPGDAAWEKIVALPPLPAPATAVAVGDFIGDGMPAIAVGTAQAGAVYLLRWTGTDWSVVAQTGYLWAPITKLIAADLSGDGLAELIATDESGGVTVFAWRERTLDPVWQSPEMYGRILHVDVFASRDDEDARIVMVDDQGRLTTWSWPLSRPDAQAFVWGTPTSLAVATVAQDTAEVIVTTNERLLYRFVLDNSQLSPAAPPLHDERLPFDRSMAIRLPGESTDRLLAYSPSGLGLWRVAGTSINLVDEGWADGLTAAAQWPGTGSLIIAEGDGVISVWTRQPTDYFAFIIDGERRELRDPPIYQQSQVMLSARDWADVFGLQLYWDSTRQRLTALGRRTYAIVTVGDRQVMLPQGIRSVSMTPILRDGRTYVPPEFPTWFGADYQWDPRRRALHVQTTLGAAGNGLVLKEER